MKKIFVLLSITLISLLSFASMAYAEGVTQVTTFGFDDYRNRDAANPSENPPTLWLNWKSDVGKSYSQPLILADYSFSHPVVISAANNKLYGWISKDLKEPQKDFVNNDPVWSLPLKGDKPTKSSPTYVEYNGRKLIFIGSDKDSSAGGAWLQVFDVSDFNNPREIYSDYNKAATDIVSAPLVMFWQGHPVVIVTCGNTSRIAIYMNLDGIGTESFDKSKVTVGNIDVSGGGRTSSSPAPVMQNTGFAVGLDGGANSGKVLVYMLNDILGEVNDKVILKSKAQYANITTKSGICASFSSSKEDPGRYIYFGDSRSRVYCYDVENKKLVWRNDDYAGTFSNHSPALGGQNVYFPAIGGTSSSDIKEKYPAGKYMPRLLAINRKTGSLEWKYELTRRITTAPMIWESGKHHPFIMVGDRSGYINSVDATNGQSAGGSKASDEISVGDTFTAGVTGEVSSAQGLLVVTTDEGIKCYTGLETDLEIVDLDTGIPEGEKAKPGNKYTAKVTYRYKQAPTNIYTWAITPPVGAFHVIGDGNLEYYQATLKTPEGKELPRIPMKEGFKDQQVAQVAKTGDTVVAEFEWTAQEKTKYLAAGINTFYPLDRKPDLLAVYPETDYQNNLIVKEVPLDVPKIDLKVKIIPDKTSYKAYSGVIPVHFIVRITRKDDSPVDVAAKMTFTAGKYSGSESYTIGPEGVAEKEFNMPAKPGKFTIKAEAWPNGYKDVYPQDNKDSVTITVTESNFTVDSHISAELLGGGPAN